jgi:GNAT superfamily N-acetyltransferase
VNVTISVIDVVEVREGQGAVCERVLRDLPEWFGIDQAVRQYVADVAGMTFLVARDAGDVLGFVALRRHNDATLEVHVMGVLRAHHRRGVGRALIEAAVARARADGARLLSVKTLAATRECAEYERTRRFYEALGFLPVEVFPTLWGPANPCLLMVRPL